MISTPLKPPPPYCSERPFHSTGRLTWKRIGGALGSVGSMRPMTLQNSGLAGVMRPAGVGPRSATASCDGACMAAESMRTALSAGPTSPLQVVAGSPLILEAASTGADDIIADSNAAHTRASIESFGIASPNPVFAAYWLAVAQLGTGSRDVKPEVVKNGSSECEPNAQACPPSPHGNEGGHGAVAPLPTLRLCKPLISSSPCCCPA